MFYLEYIVKYLGIFQIFLLLISILILLQSEDILCIILFKSG